MDKKRVYGQIGLGRLLDISVYLDNSLVYDGMIEDAPKEIKIFRNRGSWECNI